MGGRRHRMLPVDPRPSRADPEARRVRKELEKEHSYEWVPPVILTLIGIGLAYDVTKDVEKHEEKHHQEEREIEERRRRRRGDRDRDRDSRHGSSRRSRRHNDDDERGEDDEQERDRARSDDEDDRERRRRRRHRSARARSERRPRGDVQSVGYHEGLGVPVDSRLESAENGEADDSRRDGGLDRADLLEKGEGSGWSRKDFGHDSHDEYDDQGRYRRRRRNYYDEDDEDDDDFDYEYVRGRKDLDDRRTRRPLPRRRSSDW